MKKTYGQYVAIHEAFRDFISYVVRVSPDEKQDKDRVEAPSTGPYWRTLAIEQRVRTPSSFGAGHFCQTLNVLSQSGARTVSSYVPRISHFDWREVNGRFQCRGDI